jgi:hypothetical protein
MVRVRSGMVGACIVVFVSTVSTNVLSVVETQSTAVTAVISIQTGGSHKLLWASPRVAVTAAGGDGVDIHVYCIDDDPNDSLYCTLDVYSFDGRLVGQANGTDFPSPGFVTVRVPPAEYAGNLLTLFEVFPAVNRSFPGHDVLVEVISV